jgi:hypothetical protein
MRPTIWSVAFWLMVAAIGEGQQIGVPGLLPVNQASFIEGFVYTVHGATPEREKLVRTLIQVMHPAVLPNRIIFVPHWQYIYAARMYHLHVPTGMTSKMFTHLASRSVYIDADFYGGDDWLRHWMAHELGHLEKNNADEKEAEKSAATYRRRLDHTKK